MTAPHALQLHLEPVLAGLPDFARRVVAATLESLRSSSMALAVAQDRQQVFAAMEALNRHGARWVESFASHLDQAVREAMDDRAAARGRSIGRLRVDELTLVDERQAEEDIETSRTVMQIEELAEWELREVQAYMAALRGETTIRREANPLRPEVYARALSHSSRVLPLDTAPRMLLLRTAGSEMGRLLREAYASLCRGLEQKGVEPLSFRAVPTPASPAPARDPFGQVLGKLRAAAPAGAPAVPGGLEARLAELNRRIAPDSLPVPLDAPHVTVPNVLQQLQAPAAGAAPTSPDPELVSLLSKLFDQILADPRLLPPVRSVLGRLQVSVLRVALQDPTLLTEQQHPTWLLLDRIASHCAGYADVKDERLSGFLGFVEQLVGRVAAQDRPDATLYRRALQEVNDYIDAKAREAIERSRAAVEKLQRIERAEQLRSVLRQQMRQWQGPPISQSLRDFLFGPWVDVLVEAMSRYGEDGQETSELLHTVDELLWSLQPMRNAEDRARLRALLPLMTERLQRGLDLIGMPTEQRAAVLAELRAAHTKHMREPAPEDLTPEQLVQRLREEEDSAGPLWFDSGEDVDRSVLPTVPIGLMSHPETEAGRLAREAWQSRLVPGTWYLMFVQGRWVTAQLTWVSDNKQFFLFSSQQAGHSHSMTRRALERLLREGLVTVLEDRSLLPRAADSMLQDLDGPR